MNLISRKGHFYLKQSIFREVLPSPFCSHCLCILIESNSPSIHSLSILVLCSALLCQEIPLFVLLKAIGIESDAEAVLMVGKGKQFEVRVGV